MAKLYTILLIFFTFTDCACQAQKLYIWCPPAIEVKPKTGLLANELIDIVVLDGRNISKNSRIECEGQSIVQSLSAFIQKTYSSAKIMVLGDSAYYKKSSGGKITIKIGIAAYQAGFGTDISVGIGSVGGSFSYDIFPRGEWNGLTSYFVQVFDNRNTNGKKYTKEISAVVSKPNMWGYKTARGCLFASYEKANQDLLNFIDGSFME